jgi:calcineurin-like phosphoesterase family protein
MTHWYTADTHFGHEKVIALCNRPFQNAGHMDAALIENLWSKVGPDDDLWIVGDFVHGRKTDDTAYLNGIFGQLPGARKHLVIGNHDLEGTCALPWDSIANLAEVDDGKTGLKHTLCHYPMLTWNGARKGALHLFGHVHDQWAGSRNAVNVGVDQWEFMPVTIEDIARRAKALPENKHWADVEHGNDLS